MSIHIYQNPLSYSKNNALQYNFAMRMLKKIAFNAKLRVLDIGCGDGLITFEIAKIANEGCIIGTDISAQMVEHANKAYSSQQNLRFIQMDAPRNIFRDQFDIVTSFNCLHWVKDQQAVLLGISSAATSNATIALLLSHKKSHYHFALDAVCNGAKWKSYFADYQNPRSFFDAESYKKMVVASGLNIIELTEEEMIYNFDDKKQLRELFKASMANIKQVPSEKYEEFLDDYCDDFISRVKIDSKNQIPVGFWCLQIVAVKSS